MGLQIELGLGFKSGFCFLDMGELAQALLSESHFYKKDLILLYLNHKLIIGISWDYEYIIRKDTDHSCLSTLTPSSPCRTFRHIFFSGSKLWSPKPLTCLVLSLLACKGKPRKCMKEWNLVQVQTAPLVEQKYCLYSKRHFCAMVKFCQPWHMCGECGTVPPSSSWWPHKPVLISQWILWLCVPGAITSCWTWYSVEICLTSYLTYS